MLTSAIFLLLVIISVVYSTNPGGEPAKRSVSEKRGNGNCYYFNNFTQQCEKKKDYEARNSETVDDGAFEFLDTLYDQLYPPAIPQRPRRTLDIANGVTYASGLCPGNSNYTMKVFVISGHSFLGFWPHLSTCPGWVMDSRHVPSNKKTFPFFRETYHASGQAGLGDVTDTYLVAETVDIELVRNHLATLDATGTFYSSQPYDALDNNCGRVIISAILATGNFVDFPIKAWVAERLLIEPALNIMFAHPTNLLSMFPELTPQERLNVPPGSRSKKVYRYQQGKNQVNNPSCDFNVSSVVYKSCIGDLSPVLNGSTPDAFGFGIDRAEKFCLLSYNDSALNTTCGSFTRTWKTINLVEQEIIKTQIVFVDCPYCNISSSPAIYNCTEDTSVVKDAATGDEWCYGELSYTDFTNATYCGGIFNRTWTGFDFCGRNTTETNTSHVQTLTVENS